MSYRGVDSFNYATENVSLERKAQFRKRFVSKKGSFALDSPFRAMVTLFAACFSEKVSLRGQTLNFAERGINTPRIVLAKFQPLEVLWQNQ